MAELPELLEETPTRPVYDWELFRRLLGYLTRYRGRAAAAVGLIVLSSLLQLVGPLATALALDLYLRPGTGGGAGSGGDGGGEAPSGLARRLEEAWLSQSSLDPAAGLAAIAAVYLVALVLAAFVLWAQGWIMQTTGQAIMADLRRDLFAALQRQSVDYFDRHPIGRLVTRVTNDVDSLNELFTAGLVSIFGDVMLLGGIVVTLFWLDWRLALVTFAILPLLFGLSVWFKKRARESYRKVRVRLAHINAYLQEHVTGMSVVQLFGRERATAERFAEIDDEHRAANLEAIFYYAVYYPMVELITALGLGLILWFGGVQVMAGALTLGVLVAFLQYAQRFYQPLADLSEKYNILQSAMASSERVFDLLDSEPRVASPIDGWRPEVTEGRIDFRSIDFAYVEGEPVLKKLDLTVEPGETVAIVGHTGAGKSTLANLLLRLYDVDRGAVEVDGIDVRRWDLAELRSSIGLVLQDVFLFSGTVAENIHLGNPAIRREAVEEAAREVGADRFIGALEQGYDAVVHERGAGLSVGQKQLVAFARALAADPRILVLDEATSSIDTETEAQIQRALDRLLVGRTSLVIAHRLSTLQQADRIAVLHQGELRELGTHQELLAMRGIYHRLYLLQYGAEVA